MNPQNLSSCSPALPSESEHCQMVTRFGAPWHQSEWLIDRSGSNLFQDFFKPHCGNKPS